MLEYLTSSACPRIPPHLFLLAALFPRLGDRDFPRVTDFLIASHLNKIKSNRAQDLPIRYDIAARETKRVGLFYRRLLIKRIALFLSYLCFSTRGTVVENCLCTILG